MKASQPSGRLATGSTTKAPSDVLQRNCHGHQLPPVNVGIDTLLGARGQPHANMQGQVCQQHHNTQQGRSRSAPLLGEVENKSESAGESKRQVTRAGVTARNTTWHTFQIRESRERKH